MADRRSDDDAPLAPRRSLGGRPRDEEQPSSGAGKRPLSERVSAAVSAAGPSSKASSRSGSSGDPGSSRSTKSSRSDEGRRQSSGTSTGTSAPKREGGPKQRSSSARPARPKGTRKARLRLTHVDPWSVMKTAFLLSIAIGIVTVVAVALVWSVLGAAGVWESINDTVQEVLGGESGSTFDVETYLGTSRVLGFTMIVAVVDVILITAIATLGAFLYNLAAALLGGLEVTLAEDER